MRAALLRRYGIEIGAGVGPHGRAGVADRLHGPHGAAAQRRAAARRAGRGARAMIGRTARAAPLELRGARIRLRTLSRGRLRRLVRGPRPLSRVARPLGAPARGGAAHPRGPRQLRGPLRGP